MSAVMKNKQTMFKTKCSCPKTKTSSCPIKFGFRKHGLRQNENSPKPPLDAMNYMLRERQKTHKLTSSSEDAASDSTLEDCKWSLHGPTK